jgi:hypothetical protein
LLTRRNTNMSINTFVALAAIVSTAVSGLVLSPEKLTHNQAKMFCATKGTTLADVTSANMESVKVQLKGQQAWIGSWDYNYYNNACLEFNNGHIGTEACDRVNVAACNDVVLLKSANGKSAPQHENHKSGARASRRSRKDKCEPSSCDSSSYACVRDNVDCGFEYVYLTQTVSQVYTSVVPFTITTATFTSTSIIGTVAAYVATADA